MSSATMQKERITKSNSTRSRLLSLPGEIRNRIYGYALGGKTLHIRFIDGTESGRMCGGKIAVIVCRAKLSNEEAVESIRSGFESKEVDLYSDRHSSCSVPRKIRCDTKQTSPFYSVNLLQTCSQIHSEAALLPFETNTFSFNTKNVFTAFRIKLTRHQLQAITSLSLEGCNIVMDSLRDHVLTGMSELTSLKQLVVFNEVWMPPGSIHLANLMESLRPAMKLRLSVFNKTPLNSAVLCISIIQQGYCNSDYSMSLMNPMSSWYSLNGWNRMRAIRDMTAPIMPANRPMRLTRAYAHPAHINGLCEELEAMLLKGKSEEHDAEA